VRFNGLPIAVGLFAGLAAALAAAPSARAFEELTPTEALGMGGASRAWAVGDAGPLLNPSGMTLLKSYTVEGLYGYASRLSDQFLHASIVDDTSSYNLAGGLYYTYHTAAGALPGHGHEAGLSLALPFGNVLAIGGTVKYFNLSGGDAPSGNSGGVTFDVGLTARPTGILSIGVVGANLRPLHTSQATQSIGYGVALLPTPALILAADGLTRLTADNQTGRKGTSAMAGATYTLGGKAAFRAGGGYDAVTTNGYGTLGISAISEIGAIDAGVRQDLLHAVGTPRETVVNVSLRLFIPASQTQQQDPAAYINSGTP
jgi:hypothetical protein